MLACPAVFGGLFCSWFLVLRAPAALDVLTLGASKSLHPPMSSVHWPMPVHFIIGKWLLGCVLVVCSYQCRSAYLLGLCVQACFVLGDFLQVGVFLVTEGVRSVYLESIAWWVSVQQVTKSNGVALSSILAVQEGQGLLDKSCKFPVGTGPPERGGPRMLCILGLRPGGGKCQTTSQFLQFPNSCMHAISLGPPPSCMQVSMHA